MHLIAGRTFCVMKVVTLGRSKAYSTDQWANQVKGWDLILITTNLLHILVSLLQFLVRATVLFFRPKLLIPISLTSVRKFCSECIFNLTTSHCLPLVHVIILSCLDWCKFLLCFQPCPFLIQQLEWWTCSLFCWKYSRTVSLESSVISLNGNAY